MDSYEHLRLEFLLSKTLLDYSQFSNGASDDAGKTKKEILRKNDEIKQARKIVEELLSKAKLKQMAINMYETNEESNNKKKSETSSPSSSTEPKLSTSTEVPEAKESVDVPEKWAHVKAQIEATEEKHELSKDVMKKLMAGGPGFIDILNDSSTNVQDLENDQEINDALARQETEAMRTMRVLKIHRENVGKANLCIQYFAKLPYSDETRLGSTEMRKIRAVIDAVLDGSYDTKSKT